MNHRIQAAARSILNPPAKTPFQGGSIKGLMGEIGPYRPALLHPLSREELIKLGEDIFAGAVKNYSK